MKKPLLIVLALVSLLCLSNIFDEVINDSVIVDKSQYRNNAIIKGELKFIESYAY